MLDSAADCFILPVAGGVLSIVGELFVADNPAEINVSTIPEPSSLLLLALGLGGLGIWKIRRRQNGA